MHQLHEGMKRSLFFPTTISSTSPSATTRNEIKAAYQGRSFISHIVSIPLLQIFPLCFLSGDRTESTHQPASNEGTYVHLAGWLGGFHYQSWLAQYECILGYGIVFCLGLARLIIYRMERMEREGWI